MRPAVTRPGQRGVGWRPTTRRGVGRSPTDPKGGWVGLRTPLLRDARCGLRQRLADVLAMPLQPIVYVLE